MLTLTQMIKLVLDEAYDEKLRQEAEESAAIMHTGPETEDILERLPDRFNVAPIAEALEARGGMSRADFLVWLTANGYNIETKRAAKYAQKKEPEA